MLCLKETVIVFQRTAKKISTAVTIHTTCHDEVNPTIILPMGAAARAKSNDGPLPTFEEIFGPNSPPRMPPTAPEEIPRIAKTKTEVCRTSCPNKIYVALTIAPNPFKEPKIIAIGRRS